MFESLAKRRVRVVAYRPCYLEELPIIFPQQAGRRVHLPFVKYPSGVSPSGSLNLNAKAERDIPAEAAMFSTVHGFATRSCIALSAAPAQERTLYSSDYRR